MTSICQDVRHALRGLSRHRGFSAAATLTLALGIGATTAAFSVVDALLLRPLPWRDADRLVTIWMARPLWRETPALAPSWNRGMLSWPNVRDLQQRTQAFEGVGTWRRTTTVFRSDVNEVVPSMFVSASFLPVLGVIPHLGRFFDPVEDEHATDSVVISYETWTGRFGADVKILGRTVILNDASRIIVGVLPARFVFDEIAPEFVLPFGNERPQDRNAKNYAYRAVARLQPAVSLATALRDIEPTLRGEDSSARLTARLEFLKDTVMGESRRPLWTLFGAAALLLLIACANVAGLLFGHAGNKRQEMAVRTALGASRRALIQGLMVESALLGVGGTLLGVVFALWFTPTLIALSPSSIPRLMSVSVDHRFLIFSIGLAVLTTLLFGVGPSLGLSRRPPAGHLREVRSVAGKRRGMLVAIEVALAFVLVVGASLLGETVIRLASQPVGFDVENLVVVTVRHPPVAGENPAARAQQSRLLAERLGALPGVSSVAGAAAVPFAGGFGNNRIEIDGEPLSTPIFASRHQVTPAFFETMRLPLIKGRHFEANEERAAVVSESFERMYLRRQAIGRRFRYNLKSDAWYRIVGVVVDARQRRLADETGPAFYVLNADTIGEFVLRTAGDSSLTIASVRDMVRQHDPRLVVTKVDTMRTLIRQTIADEEFRAMLACLFGGLALLLALSGIYALLSQSVADRVREIGVRIALGASPSAVVRLIMSQGALPVLAGVLLGLPASLFVARLVSPLLFGANASSTSRTLLVVAVLLAVVSLVAMIIPAHRASRTDPLLALRYE